MNYEIFIKSYWNYYLDLEEEFLKTRRYVSFERKNNKTFSSEYIKLLQAVCSEIDVLAKEIAKYKDLTFKIQNSYIAKWGFTLTKYYPNLSETTILFNNDYSITPWKNAKYVEYYSKAHSLCYKLADGCSNPEWWTSYNKIKHERTTIKKDKPNYIRANLQNCVNALGALYILEVIMKNELDKDNYLISSKLFREINNI